MRCFSGSCKDGRRNARYDHRRVCSGMVAADQAAYMPHDCGVRSMRLRLVLPHSETEKSETKYQEFLVGATAKATAYCGSHGPHISTFPVVCNKENQVCGCRGPPNNHKSKGFLSRPYTRVVAGVKKRPRNQHGMFSCYLSRTRQAHIHEEKSGDGTDLKGTTRTARTIAAVSEPSRRKRRKPPPSQLPQPATNNATDTQWKEP